MRMIACAVFALCAITLGAAAQAQSPFIMVANSYQGPDNEYFSTLNAYADTGDYYSSRLVTFDSPLGEVTPEQFTFAAPSKLINVGRRAAEGCLPDVPDFILHSLADNDTPANELENLASTIAQGSSYIASSPGGCKIYGVSLGPDYIGINLQDCSFSTGYISNNQYNNFHGSNIFQNGFDWSGVSLIELQTQQLLNDGTANNGNTGCASPSQPAYQLNFYNAVWTMLAQLRPLAPNALIVAQFSFRYTSPSAMIAAMQSIVSSSAHGVDGFYLAYPVGSTFPCHYCTSANLQQVLEYWRPDGGNANVP